MVIVQFDYNGKTIIAAYSKVPQFPWKKQKFVRVTCFNGSSLLARKNDQLHPRRVCESAVYTRFI